MMCTVEALKLFLKSLPAESNFSIISFGSHCELMKMKGQTVFKNEPEFTNEALRLVDSFRADMGGTEILEPLELAKQQFKNGDNIKHVRIFLLTDGEVQNRNEVIAAAKTGNDEIRIHTFGIGGACDKDMVEQMAKRGRGSVSLIDNPEKLERNVIRALRVASEPSLKKCRL